MELPRAPPKCSYETRALEGGEAASLWLCFPIASPPCMKPGTPDTVPAEGEMWV